MEKPLSPEDISFLEEERRYYQNNLRKLGYSTLLIWLGALGLAFFTDNEAFLNGTLISTVFLAYLFYSIFYSPLQKVSGDLVDRKKVEKRLKIRKIKKTKTGTIFILDERKVAHEIDLDETGVDFRRLRKGHYLKVQFTPRRKYILAALKG